MSREVTVELEIRSIPIMEKTLRELEIGYTNKKGNLTIKRQYHNIVIDTENNSIYYDEVDCPIVNNIKEQYLKNWYVDAAIREGNTIQEEVGVDGEIVLRIGG